MGGRRDREELVRPAEVAAELPRPPRRPRSGKPALDSLRRPRLLSAPKLAEAKERLLADARAEGFDVARIVAADAVPEAASRLAEFLKDGFQGEMEWLATTAPRRGDPRDLWPEARSLLMVGLNYGPAEDPLATLAARDRASISVYARNRDYHNLIKGKLKGIAGRLAARTGAAVKVFVDTAPLMEKPLAAAAGIGWLGKHTNLVSRDFGSWLFLGAVVTDLALPPDAPETTRCGSCRTCLDACPTGAFPAPFRLDARRCISYLTIEHRGPIPHEFRKAIANRVYGCDDCLAVCPWNKFASLASEAALAARDDLVDPPLAELAMLDDAGFRARFSGSPIKRIGRDRFVRNILIAIGNSGDASLAGVALGLVDDPSPIVRGAAVWAFAELTPEAARLARARYATSETDTDVAAEWAAIA